MKSLDDLVRQHVCLRVMLRPGCAEAGPECGRDLALTRVLMQEVALSTHLRLAASAEALCRATKPQRATAIAAQQSHGGHVAATVRCSVRILRAVSWRS